MSVELPSVCPLDCPDTCSFTVTVEAGEVRKVRGSTANPLTNGVVCNKVARYYPEFVHGENRLRHPLKRVGPKGGEDFARISWEEAIDTIHDRFSAIIAEHGPQAIMPYNYAGLHGSAVFPSPRRDAAGSAAALRRCEIGGLQRHVRRRRGDAAVAAGSGEADRCLGQ